MSAKLFVFIFFLIPVSLFGQDYFVKSNNDTVFCHIDGIKSNKIFFVPAGEKPDTQEKINIYECKSISVSDKSKINNPQSIEILEAPKDEVLIYLIRPNYLINSAMNCRVKCNNILLTALKNNSYCMLILKPGEYEFYWLEKNKRSLKVTGKPGETYFIKCEQTGAITSYNVPGIPSYNGLPSIPGSNNGLPGSAGMISGGLNFDISLLNNGIGEIALKQVKKESLKLMKELSQVTVRKPLNLQSKNR